MSTTGKLRDRTALVTGGSQGIGEAVVQLFAAEGANVVFCARTETDGRSVEERTRHNGGEVTFIQADVSRESDVARVVQAAVSTSGTLDILVTCAGVTASGPIEDVSVSSWREVFDANVLGTFLVCKHAAPYLRASAHGAVIILGSTYGMIGVPGSSTYAASKAAVISLAKSLALEWATDGVRVNALCPGATETPLHRTWLDAQPDAAAAIRELKALHPLGRISSAEEQARAALFLASDDASFVTGHTLLVDGGFTAQ
jgi:NAD(P)-dependent dehydrogenase (short-subunit alcohol dehydrogenase family)